MSEQTILASVMKSRAAYNTIEKHINVGADLTEQGKVIYEAIERYYDNDHEANFVDPGVLSDAIGARLTVDKHRETFDGIVSALATSECSPANIADNYIAHKRKIAGQELATALLGDDEDAIEKARTRYEDLDSMDLDEPEDVGTYTGVDLRTMIGEQFDPKNLIKVYPDSLNRRLDGGAKRGHHIVIFARPEMGKTLTVINMIGGFLTDGWKVLYVGNEDPIADITMRIINRLTGLSKYDVLDDIELADTMARDTGYENLTLASVAPGTVREIQTLIEKHRPDVVVLDQLRNIDTKNDNFVQSLETAAKHARAWAKRYECLMVSVTQAGDSANNKAALDMGDVDSSNTGIPATADVMLGIGATIDMRSRSEVMFSLPKNKIGAKHEFFPVRQIPTLSKCESID